MLDDTRTQHKIRLAGIDAPERAQPFGQRSKQNLSDLVYRQDVVIEYTKRDRYGRIVGKVLGSGGADVCLEQIKAGMAWWYRKYAGASRAPKTGGPMMPRNRKRAPQAQGSGRTVSGRFHRGSGEGGARGPKAPPPVMEGASLDRILDTF